MRRGSGVRGPRGARRWLVRVAVAVALVYLTGFVALLITRDRYVSRAGLYLRTENGLEWQGRTGIGYHVWTSGPGEVDLWRAYAWIPLIRDAHVRWRSTGDRRARGPVPGG